MIIQIPEMGYDLNDLQSSLESIDKDIRTSLNVPDLLVEMANYRSSHGLESDNTDFLNAVAEFTSKGTDLTPEQVLTASMEWSNPVAGGRKIISNAVRAGYELAMKLIAQFNDWISRVTSKYRAAKANYESLKKDIVEMGDKYVDRGLKLSGNAQNLLQIDLKVLSDKSTLLTKFNEQAKWISSLIDVYSNALIKLANDINGYVKQVSANDDPTKQVKGINSSILEFLKAVTKLAPLTGTGPGSARSFTHIGNGALHVRGMTDELLAGLGDDKVVTTELTSLNISYSITQDNRVVIKGDHVLRALNKKECLDYVSTALTTIDDIIKYNDSMEKNLQAQLGNMESGKKALDAHEVYMSSNKIVTDGKSTMQNIGLIGEIYRYQTIVWRWGTLPITQAINHYFKVDSAMLGIVKSCVALESKNREEK